MRDKKVDFPPSDGLVHEYCRDFMEKVFYFCLRKTGSTQAAEELCSDISLAVIAALRKGVRPENFAAWVWQVARNRHADYAESRRKTRERSAGEDISEYELEDGSEHFEDRLIREEELKLIRRELAFISSDYRDILTAFYIDDLSLKDISRSLNLPENTVKSRLFRARKILKEGINMAREFGPKSYKPEEVIFNGSGWFPANNSPFDEVKKKIPKNILLEASNNPETAEELAIALGVAMPYMEDEIEGLLRTTLLKKVGGKYITNIPILSRDIQKKLYDVQIGSSNEGADLLQSVAEYSLPKIKALGCIRNGRITDNELLWYIADGVLRSAKCLPLSPAVRENGEKWLLVGFEEYDHPAYGGIDNRSTATDNMAFARQTVCGFGGSEDNPDVEFAAGSITLLADVIKNGRKVTELSESEKLLWKNVEGVYAHTEPDGSVTPDILVFEGKISSDCTPQVCADIFKSHPDFEELRQLCKKVREELVKILREDSSPVIAGQIELTAEMTDRFGDIILEELAERRTLKPLIGPDRYKGTSWILV